MTDKEKQIIALANAYNNTLYNNQTLQVPINIFTAPSNPWYVETIRSKQGLGDIAFAIKRTNPDNIPTDIYEIHVDSQVVKTATKSLINYSKSKWQDAFTVGEGDAVAIEFDGYWVKDKKNRYNLITEEVPYIFWVDIDNNLWCQKWNDITTLTQLASDVVKVSAIRGWKNVNYWELDQGLIVAYIKSDGAVYYRNYCRQPNGTSVAWETEQTISTLPTPAQSIRLFRTNDYRIGFLSESNGTITWTLTERDWAGMGIPLERITVSPATVSVDFREISYVDSYVTESIDVTGSTISVDLRYANTDNQFNLIYNQAVIIDNTENWGKELIFTVAHRLYNYAVSDFEIVDSYNRSYYPNKISEIADKTYKLEFTNTNNFNNVGNIGLLKFKGLTTTNSEGILYLPFEKEFHPTNLVPTEIPLPEVEAIWNE